VAGDSELSGPDFTNGIDSDDLDDDELLLGHAHGEAVMLARTADGVVAVGATCTHWNGPLAEGVRDGDDVHCPWHHACFSLRTGATLRPPALHDLPRWNVEERAGRIVVGDRIDPAEAAPKPSRPGEGPASVVIIGASAAGNGVAETLRREGYTGSVTMVDPDPDVPCDRPNLSKDYMAGNAPEEWIPLHPASFYQEHDIDLRLGRRATAIDTTARSVTLDDGAKDVGATNGWRMDEVLPSAQVIERLQREWPLEPLEATLPGETAQRWRYADGGGEVGVISSVTQAFCHDCNRARLSTEGKLYLCLFAHGGHDLRALLRGGADDARIGDAISDIWRGRDDRYSELRGSAATDDSSARRVEMHYIGG
jgi:nitrite reductase/ring-hydroxylating ferredoxin subunit